MQQNLQPFEDAGDQSFTSLQTLSMEESEQSELDEEELDLHDHVKVLREASSSLELKITTLKYLRRQVKKVQPEKVLRMLNYGYLSYLSEQVRLPISRISKESIYNLCGLLKLQKQHFSFRSCNLLIEKIVLLKVCERIANLMSFLMQNDHFGKLLNKLLWLNIEIVNYCQLKQTNNANHGGQVNQQAQVFNHFQIIHNDNNNDQGNNENHPNQLHEDQDLQQNENQIENNDQPNQGVVGNSYHNKYEDTSVSSNDEEGQEENLDYDDEQDDEDLLEERKDTNIHENTKKENDI